MDALTLRPKISVFVSRLLVSTSMRGADAVAVEGLSICEVGVGLTWIRGGVIPV